jgi:hypothetical protein
MVPSQTRAAREKQRRELTRMSACTIVLITATILCASAIRKRVRRPAAVRRQRCPFETVVQYLSPHDFTRCFRMPRNVLCKLLSLLKPRLMRNANKGRRSSGGIIEPAVRLPCRTEHNIQRLYLDSGRRPRDKNRCLEFRLTMPQNCVSSPKASAHPAFQIAR